jgi:hypothetical protein
MLRNSACVTTVHNRAAYSHFRFICTNRTIRTLPLSPRALTKLSLRAYACAGNVEQISFALEIGRMWVRLLRGGVRKLSQDLLRWLRDISIDMGAALLGSYAGSYIEKQMGSDSGVHGKAIGASVGMAAQTVYKKIMNAGGRQPTEADARAMLQPEINLIWLVRGKDNGQLAWHYVLVHQLATGSLDVSHYGMILESGWGQDPPAEVTRAIDREYVS